MTITINEYFLLSPNWKESVFQRRKWKTSIQTTIKKQEKRTANYSWPRKSIRYTVQCMDIEETNYLRRVLYKSLHNVWGAPLWPEWTRLSADALLGQNTLNVGSTLNRHFEVGGRCVLLNDYKSYEVGIITEKTDTSITLKNNLTATWSNNTYVYPVIPSLMNINQTLTAKVSGYDEFLVEFFELIDEDVDVDHFIFSDPAFPTYLSFPVFTKKPNWSTEVNLDLFHPYDVLEFLGPSTHSTIVPETNLTIPATFLNVSNAELNEIFGFFDTQKGRWGNFWFPSFNDDVQVTEAFVSSDTTFTIKDINWSTYWDINDIEGKHLIFTFPDGTNAYKTIGSAPSSTQITITEAIGESVSASLLQYLQVSFLHLGRFDLDEIEVDRKTGEYSEMVLKFKSVYGITL